MKTWVRIPIPLKIMKEYTYSGRESRQTAEMLKQGHVCKVLGIGQSMAPLLKSKQEVICEPIKDDTTLRKRDIVLCKVRGNYYLHLIHGIKNGDQFLIGNNHGHMNGWISKSQIFGKVTEIL